MGIAQAIERVRRQAGRAGLGAVIGGVGEQLRSDAVPTPLRGAAWRIAALLDAACPHAQAKPEQRARDLIVEDRIAIQRNRADQRSAAAAPPAPRPADELVPPASSARAPAPSATAVDSGAQPAAPADETPVSAAAVGATPSFNVTPVVVTPVDATPVDEGPVDAFEAVVEVDASAVTAAEPIEARVPSAAGAANATRANERGREATASSLAPPTDAASPGETAHEASTSTVTQPPPAKPRSRGKSAQKRSTPPAAAPSEPPAAKEKLAAANEDAKTLAHSNPRGSKRRSGSRGDTGKKK